MRRSLDKQEKWVYNILYSKIDDMLCFARLERNHSSYSKEKLNFSSIVEDVCEDMALLRDKNITLTKKIEPDMEILGL